MQIRVQKRWLIKMYSTEDFIMEPEGLEMRLKGVKALIQVQKQIASPPNPSNAPLGSHLTQPQPSTNCLPGPVVNKAEFHFFP